MGVCLLIGTVTEVTYTGQSDTETERQEHRDLSRVAQGALKLPSVPRDDSVTDLESFAFADW